MLYTEEKQIEEPANVSMSIGNINASQASVHEEGRKLNFWGRSLMICGECSGFQTFPVRRCHETLIEGYTGRFQKMCSQENVLTYLSVLGRGLLIPREPTTLLPRSFGLDEDGAT